MGKALSKQKTKSLRKAALARAVRALRAVKVVASESIEAVTFEAAPAVKVEVEAPVTPQAAPAVEVEVEAPVTPQAELAVDVEVEAPMAPGPALEPALWPEAGVKVAIGVEHLTHCVRVGETAVCEGPCSKHLDEVMIRLDSVKVLTSLRVPRSILVPIGERMSIMRLWDK